MSKERDLLQTALGILEDYEWGYGGDHHKSPEASILNDIRKLLAQPEPEQQAEAWIIVNKETGYRTQVSDLTPFLYHREIFEVIPLYTAPQKREPLSEKEITKNTPKLIHIGERLAFAAGIRFAEKMQCIGVDDENRA
jgi:hypothetical protein